MKDQAGQTEESDGEMEVQMAIYTDDEIVQLLIANAGNDGDVEKGSC